MTRREEVQVPDIGDFHDVEIVEVVVRVGDTVAAEAPLITLETDKASMEVPSPLAGRIAELKVAKGDRVSKGSVIAILEVDESAAVAAPAPARAAAPAAPARRETAVAQAPPAPVRPAGTLPPIDEATFGKAHASPAVRKFARELGVNLIQVKGSGTQGPCPAGRRQGLRQGDPHRPGGRPGCGGTAEGARGGFRAAMARSRSSHYRACAGSPARACRPAGSIFPMSRSTMRRISRSWRQRRQKQKARAGKAGIKLTPLAFVMKACVLALQEFPDFNTSLSADGTALIHKKYHHLGFAADTPQGLMVPVIRDADAKEPVRRWRANSPSSAPGRARASSAPRRCGRQFHRVQPRRHRRHVLHADRECAGGGNSRRRPVSAKAGLAGGQLCAATDAAAVPVLRSSRHRRRDRCRASPRSCAEALGEPERLES